MPKSKKLFMKDQKQLRDCLGKLMEIIGGLSEGNQQKLMTWIRKMVLRKLPEHKRDVQEWMQNTKGDEVSMGLAKVLNDMVEESKREGQQEARQEVAPYSREPRA